MKSNTGRYLFTEDLDYSRTSNQSIWGDGDLETLKVLEKLAGDKKLSGEWLNFAAGDGRYNNLLLGEADKVMATDADDDALKKLQRVTPEELAAKLSVAVQDITKPFPFNDGAFDGVFNTGTLHLFPESVLEEIIRETARVIKPGGLFIFDFATDIKRVKEDGTVVLRSEAEYTKLPVRKLLSELLEKQKFQARFFECSVLPEKVTSGAGTYTFSCNYWLVVSNKPGVINT